MLRLHTLSSLRLTLLRLVVAFSMGHGVFAYAFCQAFSKAHPSSDVASYNVYQTIACPIVRGFFGLAFLFINKPKTSRNISVSTVKP
jgi:hypothetical protein